MKIVIKLYYNLKQTQEALTKTELSILLFPEDNELISMKVKLLKELKRFEELSEYLDYVLNTLNLDLTDFQKKDIFI